MRKYLFGTGIVGVILSGLGLLKEARGENFTWRVGLSWLSWLITLALAVGAIIDVRRASAGRLIADDSPVYGDRNDLYRSRLSKPGRTRR